MIQLIKKIALGSLLSLFIISCSDKKTDMNLPQEKSVGNTENTVELTNEQFKIAEITIGKIELKSLSGAIKVNGMLDVPPQNLVSVSAPMAGFLKSTELLQGMKVRKGQVIAVLQNADYIQLQQDYLDYKSQLEYLDAEYKRQQELAKESVNSQKTVLQSKTQYQSMMAKVNGLKAKLGLLGINTTQIESGSFQNTISILSPINGYVTQVNVNIGIFVNPTDVMFKIVDTEHLHAELIVFEKDIPNIKIGQKVRFTLANEQTERTATVHLIGREISEDRTVRIHCHLDKEDNNLLPGMYLKAYVEAGSKNVTALPTNAVVNFDGSDYIFIAIPSQDKNRRSFKMLAITKGVSDENFTEIHLPEKIAADAEFVVNGAFDVLAKMKNNEEGE